MYHRMLTGTPGLHPSDADGSSPVKATLKCLHACIPSVMSDSCYAMDYNPPGSSVFGGIRQARILETVAMASSDADKTPLEGKITPLVENTCFSDISLR